MLSPAGHAMALYDINCKHCLTLLSGERDRVSRNPRPRTLLYRLLTLLRYHVLVKLFWHLPPTNIFLQTNHPIRRHHFPASPDSNAWFVNRLDGDGDSFTWIRCVVAGKHLRHAGQRPSRTAAEEPWTTAPPPPPGQQRAPQHRFLGSAQWTTEYKCMRWSFSV